MWNLDAGKVYVNEGSRTHYSLKVGMNGGAMGAADFGGEIIFKGKCDPPYIPEIVNENGASYNLADFEPFGTEDASYIVIRADDVNKVVDNRMSGNTDVQIIYIEDGVTAIDAGAFKGCTSLTIVRLPKTIESIGAQAFMDCAFLAHVRNLPSERNVIGKDAFTNAPASYDIEEHFQKLGK